jgi:hypothetical protein
MAAQERRDYGELRTIAGASHASKSAAKWPRRSFGQLPEYLSRDHFRFQKLRSMESKAICSTDAGWSE